MHKRIFNASKSTWVVRHDTTSVLRLYTSSLVFWLFSPLYAQEVIVPLIVEKTVILWTEVLSLDNSIPVLRALSLEMPRLESLFICLLLQKYGDVYRTSLIGTAYEIAISGLNQSFLNILYSTQSTPQNLTPPFTAGIRLSRSVEFAARPENRRLWRRWRCRRWIVVKEKREVGRSANLPALPPSSSWWLQWLTSCSQGSNILLPVLQNSQNCS